MISEQNEKKNIELLAAQRYLYSSAKRTLHLQFILDMPVMLLLGGFAAILRSSTAMGALGLQPYDLKWFVTISGLAVALLDSLLLERHAGSCKLRGARVQELFDSRVLELPWNDVFVGEQPDREDVLNMAAKYCRNREGFLELENWYPCVAARLPQHCARLLCQRENMAWDSDLRRKFVGHVVLAAVLTLVLLLGIAMAGRFTVTDFLAFVLAPFMPALTFTIRQARANKRTIESTDDLRRRTQNSLQACLEGKLDEAGASAVSRQIQDRIYSHRKDAPLVPDFYYRMYQRSSEAIATRTASDIVDEYQQENP